ncbi:hypothetical protein CHR28_06970 [Streptomyces sp. XY006]|nr:hypothetical protein CHR28_06970 [Streptomyces sp. XY006]
MRRRTPADIGRRPAQGDGLAAVGHTQPEAYRAAAEARGGTGRDTHGADADRDDGDGRERGAQDGRECRAE